MAKLKKETIKNKEIKKDILMSFRRHKIIKEHTFFTARSLDVLFGFPLARSNTERSRSLSLCSLSLTTMKDRKKHVS